MNTWVYFFYHANIFFVSGGQDFDGILMNYVYTEYMQLSNNDIFANNRWVKRLRNECRMAKESLSFITSTVNIHVNGKK